VGLADDRKTNFYDEILGDEHPKVETVTVGDGVREWTVTGKGTDEVASDGRGNITELEPNVERFLFRVGKDEQHVKSGIAAPVRGLWVLRSGESARYSWTGRILAAVPHAHTLEFTREIGLQAGSTR
jgi:hypothetical protein